MTFEIVSTKLLVNSTARNKSFPLIRFYFLSVGASGTFMFLLRSFPFCLQVKLFLKVLSIYENRTQRAQLNPTCVVTKCSGCTRIVSIVDEGSREG